MKAPITNTKAYAAAVASGEYSQRVMDEERQAAARAKLVSLKALTSSGSDDWRTPPSILAPVRRAYCEGPDYQIDLDPCSQPDNPTGARTFWHLTDGVDGLKATWLREPAANVVFVNPPFSQLKLWAAKVAHEAEIGTRILVVAKVGFCPDWSKALLRASRGVFMVASERIAYLKPDGGEGVANSPTFETALFPINLDPALFVAQAPTWRILRETTHADMSRMGQPAEAAVVEQAVTL